MGMSVAEWLETSTDGLPRGAVRISVDGASSAVAIALCLTTPVIRTLTPMQLDVFRTLCRLQLEEGAHSLLPDVMEAYVQLAFRPWWDAQVADLPDECA
jgi:hypothetical protein